MPLSRTVLRIALPWLMLVWLLAGASAVRAAPAVVLQVQDAIGPATADYIVRGLGRAAQQQAPLVVLELDTPGGLDTSMRQIIQAILASPVPVAVYVWPQGARAASAGTYILYAAQIAAMAPATTLGAATPVEVGLGGESKSPLAPASAESGAAGGGDAMTAKRVNDAAAFIRGLAQRRGRNAEWAERAVREAVTLTASEALRQRVVDVVAVDVPDLLRQVDGRSVEVPAGKVVLQTSGTGIERIAPDWRQQLLAAITHPNVALILMMIGIYGLIFEFMSPGSGIGGVAGAICLLLGLYAMQLLSVNYAGLGLLLLGIALLVAEAVLSTFGVLGVGGVVAFVAGGILLFDNDVPGFGVPVTLIAVLALTSVAVVMVSANLALRSRRRPVVSGREQLVGAQGEIIEANADEAWAEVLGERWRVQSDRPLAAGQHVRVLGLHGLTLEVQVDHHAKGGPA